MGSGVAAGRIVLTASDLASLQSGDTVQGWTATALAETLKDAADLSDPNPVEGEHVYNQLLHNYPPKAIEWVKDPRIHWIGPVEIPLARVNTSDESSWAASHEAAAVRRFAREMKAGTGHTNPVVMVQKPGESKTEVIDGHHRYLACRLLHWPCKSYVGFLPRADGPWDETHSLQIHSGSDPANKSAKPDLPVAAGLAVRAADTGRVLMLQRAFDEDDDAGGCWEFAGGRLEDGEDPLEAAKREWAEETGRPVPDGDLTGLWNASNGLYRGFVLTVPSEDAVDIFGDRDEVSNPDDPDRDAIEALAWFDPRHLKDNPALRPELAEDVKRVRRALKSAPSPAGGGGLGKSAETPVVSTVHAPLGREGLWHTPSKKVPEMQQLPALTGPTCRTRPAP
jgi:8-oxo-dGTP pyrophosphatase MutT (NUDIX family)